jgi:hypothetical protein
MTIAGLPCPVHAFWHGAELLSLPANAAFGHRTLLRETLRLLRERTAP